MKIAVIPARGGSKRIPRKNIKDFCGKPMISWAIKTAQESGLFDRVIVSTDDLEIASIARELGGEVPFLRPAKLADDLTPTVPVIANCIKTCMDMGWMIEYACCIYPCAPFIEKADLVRAFNLMIKKNADFIYPVTEYAHPIQRGMRLLPTGQMEFIYKEHELTRTQDFEKIFHDSGQFYWGTASAWLEQKKMHTDGLGMQIPNWRVVDIDTEHDWVRAELIHKLRKDNVDIYG